MFQSLLPDNSTAFELSVEEACDFTDLVATPISAIHGLKYARPLNVTVAPWLVIEYGLGPISAYFNNVEDLIDNGRAWQKIRGTPAALAAALNWIGYGSITLEEVLITRRRWHLYQIDMGEIPTAAQEVQVLTDAEYLADLSDPARSEFFRGYFGYDVRALEFGNGKFSRSMLGDSSGVRLPGQNVKWSHGRSHPIQVLATGYDWSPLGLDFANGDILSWTDDLTWDLPGVTWAGVTDAKALRAHLVARRKTYLGFFNSVGDPVGYALVVRAVKDVSAEPGLDAAYTHMRYDVLTGFGDAYGETVASVAVVLNGEPVDPSIPFKRWLEPDEIVFPNGEIRIGQTAFAHTFMATVRENILFTLGIQ